MIDLFERRFSVDETVRRHKPAPEAYHTVATALKVSPADICLIASHVWDTIGAGAGYLPRSWYLASVASFCGCHHHSLCRYQSMVAASPARKSP